MSSAFSARCFVIPASAQQGEVEAGTRRKVKRLLSFQRYCHASRLLRGLVPHTPGSLHLLDDDYLGQAAVGPLYIYTYVFQRCRYPKIVLKRVFFLQHMLSKVGTWNFDIFLFDRLTNGKCRVVVPDLPPPSQHGVSHMFCTVR